MDLNYRVEHTCSVTNARAGRLRTTHGEVPTPMFMPVGTQATVKGVQPEELEALGARIILGNTYHLAIRPGIETVRALGGMHRMAGWRRSILTDSGGFQMLSLANLRKVSEEGVKFRSHLDGALLDLTGVWTSCFMLLFALVASALAWMHFAIRRMERARTPELAALPELPEMAGLHPSPDAGAPRAAS